MNINKDVSVDFEALIDDNKLYIKINLKRDYITFNKDGFKINSEQYKCMLMDTFEESTQNLELIK